MTFPAFWNEAWCAASTEVWTAALVNHLWQSTVVVLIAWLLALTLRRNQARTRYWVWMIASAKFLIPFSLLIVAGESLRTAVAVPIRRPALAAVMEQITQPFSQTTSAADHLSKAPVVPEHYANLLSVILVALWLCGFLSIVFSWVRGWWTIRAAVRASSPMQIKLSANVPVLSSPRLLEPGVFGLVRPVLLLPENISDRLSAPQLSAIVAHELWHVRRRDNLTAAIHMLVVATFWFHPAVWWIRARLLEERERACDEAVLQSGNEAEVYAEGILSVCRYYFEFPLECTSGISGSDLKTRIARIMTQRFADKLTFDRKLLLAAVGVVAIVGPILCGTINVPRVRAQSPTTDWQAAAGGNQTFDVASVKPNISSDPAHANFPLDPWDSYPSAGGLLSVTNFSLSTYISFAFKLPPGQDPSQMPKWATQERFDIQARAEGSPTKDQMRLMMQSLLADRFKLAVHTENRQAPVFGLVLVKPGKTGADLQPHSNDRPCADPYPSAPAAGSAPISPAKPADSFSVCGMLIAMRSSTPGRIRVGARKVTMGQIAGMLPAAAMGGLDRPILDQTGLVGSFDFSIEFTPESKRPSPDFQSDPSGITFLEALKDQLGLKLKSQKGPVEVLVIDHVEKPSEN